MQLELLTAPIQSIIVPHESLNFDDKVELAIDTIKLQLKCEKITALAYSSGKDSSLILSLALHALEELKDEGYTSSTLHVIHSNTGYENPLIDVYSKQEIKKLERFITDKCLNAKVWVANPNISNDYIVQMIGGRTIATTPDASSSKCQQYLKSAPLSKLNRKILKHEKQTKGIKRPRLCVLIGTRKDESVVRGKAMKKRGENSFDPVYNELSKQWTLSPIADFTELDVYEYLGMVSSCLIDTYSDFKNMLQIYRDSAAGECMVNIYASGQVSKKGGCGSRHGCWCCLKISRDQSMENMLEKEDKSNEFMRPLNALRNYIKARHYDLSSRNWIARTVNTEDGTVKISPNSYGPEMCLDLLRYSLTIDAREIEAADALGIEPRFSIMSLQKILAVDALWNRYGYQKGLTACATYDEIFNQGVRYDIPDTPYSEKTPIPAARSIPFTDKYYGDTHFGLYDIDLAMADPDQHCDHDINVETEFEIDEEGAELFFSFELENALCMYHQDDELLNPMAGLHYLLRLGVLSINKGGHSTWFKMMQMGNQIWRHGIRHLLSDPEALITKLEANAATENKTHRK